METRNIFGDKEHNDAYKADAVVRIKLWDKLILLFRRSKFKGYMVPIETVWAMFNLDPEKEAVRICGYAHLSLGAFTWIQTQDINDQPKTLCIDLDAVPYYLSTVPTPVMDDESAELINRISIIAQAKLADYFRIGKNNLDKRFDYLYGLEEFLFDMTTLDQEDGTEGDEEDPTSV